MKSPFWLVKTSEVLVKNLDRLDRRRGFPGKKANTLTWLFVELSHTFGSTPYQSYNYIGADCADILMAALSRMKNRRLTKDSDLVKPVAISAYKSFAHGISHEYWTFICSGFRVVRSRVDHFRIVAPNYLNL